MTINIKIQVNDKKQLRKYLAELGHKVFTHKGVPDLPEELTPEQQAACEEERKMNHIQIDTQE